MTTPSMPKHGLQIRTTLVQLPAMKKKFLSIVIRQKKKLKHEEDCLILYRYHFIYLIEIAKALICVLLLLRNRKVQVVWITY